MAQRNKNQQIERRQKEDGDGQGQDGDDRSSRWGIVRNRSTVSPHALAAGMGRQDRERLRALPIAPNDAPLGRWLHGGMGSFPLFPPYGKLVGAMSKKKDLRIYGVREQDGYIQIQFNPPTPVEVGVLNE